MSFYILYEGKPCLVHTDVGEGHFTEVVFEQIEEEPASLELSSEDA
jgi:hypothetical protein